MAFLRKEHKESYTVVNNDVFNSGLSLKARGLICTMLSLPDDWEFSENGLCAILNDGKASIRTAVKELEAAGFLSRERERDELGRMGKCVWVVSDFPQLENPNCENRKLDNRNYGNRKQLNTNQQSTNQQSTKRQSTKVRHKHGEYQNVLLSDTDLAKLKAEFPADWQERIERLSAYMASTGKSYKNHLATIRNWARMDAKRNGDSYGNPYGNPYGSNQKKEVEIDAQYVGLF